MIPGTVEAAARNFYGVFFDMFPGWYRTRCLEKFTEYINPDCAEAKEHTGH